MFEYLALFAVISAAWIFDLVEDKPADLRTKNVVAPRSLGECFAKADLREPGSVERSGIKKARARVPGRVDVASASSSAMFRYMLQSGAVRNPNGPANSASLTLI
jgi:hypothetical protein